MAAAGWISRPAIAEIPWRCPERLDRPGRRRGGWSGEAARPGRQAGRPHRRL